MKSSLRYFICTFLFSIIFTVVISGSLQPPISDLLQKINSARAGDTVYVSNGTYSNINIEIKKQFSRNVVIRPKVFGDVTFTGPVLFKLTNCSKIKFEGFNFSKTSGSTFILNGSKNIEIANNYFQSCGTNPNHSIIRILNGSPNNVIDYNTFNDSRSQGILIATYANKPLDKLNTGTKIFRNYFCNVKDVKEAYPDKGKNGMESMMIGFGGDVTQTYELRTEIYQNLFENIIGDEWEIISNKTSSNIIRQNTFLNNKSGLSIRSGNNVEITDNYFDNTDKGIRLFGQGHVIKNNYFVNCDVSIRMPTTDFAAGDKSTYTGYFQQDGISISDNFIVNPLKHDITMDEDKRKLHPQNISISGNEVYYTDKRRVLNTDQNKSIKSLANNKYLALANDDKSGPEKSKSIWHSRITNLRNAFPFKTNDSSVGADWKR